MLGAITDAIIGSASEARPVRTTEIEPFPLRPASQTTVCLRGSTHLNTIPFALTARFARGSAARTKSPAPVAPEIPCLPRWWCLRPSSRAL
jgi:hypothetical protein